MSAECSENPLDVPVIEKRIGGHITFNDLLTLISALSTLISCCISFYLVIRHMSNYTKPKLQRQLETLVIPLLPDLKLTFEYRIIRILLMVPIYTIMCTLSIAYYRKNVYLGAVYEFYESLVLAGFFLLLCNLLRADIPSLRRVFASLEPLPWIWPIRIWQLMFRCGRRKGQPINGLKWFHIIWVGVFQFSIIKFGGALAKIITEALNVYCEDVTSPNHAQIYIQIVEIISLATCMFFLIQFYIQTKVTLKEHRPLLKFLAIKLVVFLFYVQTFIVSKLTSSGGPAQPTPYVSYPSFAVGVPNALLCVEMIIISVMHIFAYPWKPYKAQPSGHKPIAPIDEVSAGEFLYPEGLVSQGGFMGWRALADVLNLSDIFISFFRGCRWLVQTRRIKAEVVPLRQFGPEQNYGYQGSPEALDRWRTNDLGEALVAESRTRSREQ